MKPITVFERDGKLISRSLEAELKLIRKDAEEMAKICSELYQLKSQAVDRLNKRHKDSPFP